jgi:hypothetical protein
VKFTEACQKKGGPKLWHRLLQRSASESGRLCHGDGRHEGGTRRRRALMLPILSSSSERRRFIDWVC